MSPSGLFEIIAQTKQLKDCELERIGLRRSQDSDLRSSKYERSSGIAGRQQRHPKLPLANLDGPGKRVAHTLL
jgi:hypothetical protein